MPRDKGEGEGRPKLRRTSSMVYVDKGEDWWSVDAFGLCVCVMLF